MKFRYAGIGVALVFIAHVANATPYIDTVNVTNPTSGSDGLFDGTVAMATSFTAPKSDFSRISLLLGAGTPSDGGSALVYLVPDDGTGSAGKAGNPTASFTGNQFSSFTGAQLLGTIKDSSLAAAGSGSTLVKLYATPTITTRNNEYWIGLVPNANSSVQWFYGQRNDGAGVTNQSTYFASSSASGGGSTTVLDTNISVGGPYGLIVSTPEPASLAILGAGLAGIGYFRRRATKRA